MRRLLVAVLFAALLLPNAALACDGCFVPPGQTNAPVLQNAERILFAHDAVTKKSYVWVEIRYAGPPGDFSWVLPSPKQPDVSVGDSWLFDRLDLATAAQFKLDFDGSENCSYSSTQSSGVGCGSAMSDSAGSANLAFPSESGKGINDDGVTVLKHDQVGPYDYELVQATSKTEGAAKMVKWLNDHGFAVPAKSTPIMDDHVARGDVFIAVRLKAGATVKEVRPIALVMDDSEACVPLRLTSIAAVDDMSVIVTLAGEGRAIPKNHMHVAVNPARIDWFNQAKNYDQVLAAAIDDASGRAFATEYAGKLPQTVTTVANINMNAVSTVTPTFDLTALNTDLLAKTTTRQAAWNRVLAQKLPITSSVATILEKYLQQAGNQDPVTYYQNLATTNGAIIDPLFDVDGQALAAELESGFCKAVREMGTRLGSATKVTRLVMRISPAEMLHDPVFAYSTTLPDVSNVTNAIAHGVCRGGSYNIDAERLTLANLGSWVFPMADGNIANLKTAADPRFASAPAALRVEVLDETGEPFLVKPDDVGKVDGAIANAHAGAPSLTIKLDPGDVRWTPPATDALYGTSAASSTGNSCQQGRSPAIPAALLLLVAGAIFLVRRRRAE
jgi:MYXO-CTERM domain-containing protein